MERQDKCRILTLCLPVFRTLSFPLASFKDGQWGCLHFLLLFMAFCIQGSRHCWCVFFHYRNILINTEIALALTGVKPFSPASLSLYSLSVVSDSFFASWNDKMVQVHLLHFCLDLASAVSPKSLVHFIWESVFREHLVSARVGFTVSEFWASWKGSNCQEAPVSSWTKVIKRVKQYSADSKQGRGEQAKEKTRTWY